MVPWPLGLVPRAIITALPPMPWPDYCDSCEEEGRLRSGREANRVPGGRSNEENISPRRASLYLNPITDLLSCPLKARSVGRTYFYELNLLSS